MYRISELAQLAGLSRTALLYYEKQGLLRAQRQSNGYRLYSEQDRQRLYLLQQLQAGGLSLSECKACLDAKLNQSLLQARLQKLDHEIAQKQQARHLLASLLGHSTLRAWHQAIDQAAPDAHLSWLKQQGFNEKEALRLKWLSHDMNEHEQYMADFMAVYQGLSYWAPGSAEDTLRALALLSPPPATLLEIGCGKGIATTVLAQHTTAAITAIDNEPAALEALQHQLETLGFTKRVTALCASMTELPFAEQSFDAIWSEGSAYIMGLVQALRYWKTFLKPGGYLVLSELVWLTDTPSPEARDFWQQGYPDMQNIATCIKRMQEAGYQLVDQFSLSDQAWQNYYQPLQERIDAMKPQLPNSRALLDSQQEINIYRQYGAEFGYQMFVLRG